MSEKSISIYFRKFPGSGQIILRLLCGLDGVGGGSWKNRIKWNHEMGFAKYPRNWIFKSGRVFAESIGIIEWQILSWVQAPITGFSCFSSLRTFQRWLALNRVTFLTSDIIFDPLFGMFCLIQVDKLKLREIGPGHVLDYLQGSRRRSVPIAIRIGLGLGEIELHLS